MNECSEGCPCPEWGCDAVSSTSGDFTQSTTPVGPTTETTSVVTRPQTTPSADNEDAYLLIFNPTLSKEDSQPTMRQLKFTWLLGEYCCEEKIDEVFLNSPTAFDTERIFGLFLLPECHFQALMS